MPLIDLKDIHFTYTGRKRETLQGVSVSFHRGETVLLLGASGSGKSTLALCLNGLIPQTDLGTFHGTTVISGHDTISTPIATLSQHVGMVFQDPDAQSVMQTVEEEIAFGLENLCVPPEEMEERITAALEQIGLTAVRNALIASLSGGYKQRLAIASALAMHPHILVLDEPTANLDPMGTRDVFAAIQELKHTGRYTIVLIEHKLDEMVHLIDRVIVLATGGKVLVDDDPRTVFGEHATLLTEHGIWIPQVVLLAHRLRASGWLLDPFPITRAELIDAWQCASVELCPLPPTTNPTIQSVLSTELCTPALEISHLSFQVGPRKILHDISLRIPEGNFLALVGANGAGKTTLAYHLANILHPSRSCVFLQGQDITRLSSDKLYQQIGFVFQNPEHQFVTSSVEEELRFSLRQAHLSEHEITQRVQRILEQFGLSHYARAHPFTLSHGEKRRLSVATMLLSDQHLLILDEPTFGQDQRNATALLEILRTLNQEGKTIIIITHDMALVAAYASHVVVLEQGKVHYHGPTAQFFAQPDLLSLAHAELPPIAELTRHLTTHEQIALTLEQLMARIPSVNEVQSL